MSPRCGRGTYVSALEVNGFDPQRDLFWKVASRVQCKPAINYQNRPSNAVPTLVAVVKIIIFGIPTRERVSKSPL